MAIGTSIVGATTGCSIRHQLLQHRLGGREASEGDDAQAQGQHGKDETDPGANPISFQPCGVSKIVVMNCVKD